MKQVPTPGEVIATHGEQALRVVVAEISAAVRRGDDVEVKAWDAVLRALEAQVDLGQAFGA